MKRMRIKSKFVIVLVINSEDDWKRLISIKLLFDDSSSCKLQELSIWAPQWPGIGVDKYVVFIKIMMLPKEL